MTSTRTRLRPNHIVVVGHDDRESAPSQEPWPGDSNGH
jgi:hypothetical protein